MHITRRESIGTIAALGATLVAPRMASAQGREVKVAMLAPLSGPWGRQGQLMKIGAEMGIEDINAQGGIRALGGAKMKLVIVDAGNSVEQAKNAAQRLVAGEPDLVAGTGAWLSSFTLAVTEITERAGLPWLTLSYADPITSRGFRYIIQTSATSSNQAAQSMPAVLDMAERATGQRPKTVALVGDSTATPQAFLNPLRQGGFEKLGVKIVSDQTYTPPLSDATNLVQTVRSLQPKPDFLIFYSTNAPDAVLFLKKMKEFGITGDRLPIIAPGAVHLGNPEILNLLSKDELEGLIMIIAHWYSKKQENLPSLTKRSGERWLGQDVLVTYGDMLLIKDAIERAKSIDRDKVMAALRSTDTDTGPAPYFNGRLKFDEAGRRVGAPVIMVQWQNGVPVTVGPPDEAFAQPYWPKK